MADAQQTLDDLVAATKAVLEHLVLESLEEEQIRAVAMELISSTDSGKLEPIISRDLQSIWGPRVNLTGPEMRAIKPKIVYHTVVAAQVTAAILADFNWCNAHNVVRKEATPLIHKLARAIGRNYCSPSCRQLNQYGERPTVKDLIDWSVSPVFDIRKYASELPECNRLLKLVPELSGAQPEIMRLIPAEHLRRWIKLELTSRLSYIQPQVAVDAT